MTEPEWWDGCDAVPQAAETARVTTQDDLALRRKLYGVRERLFLEFPWLNAVAVDAIVRRCSADLTSVDVSARAEMVEQLARNRLTMIAIQ